MLILQYLNYLNFGLPYSLNYYLSVDGDESTKLKIKKNTLAINFFICVILVFFSIILNQFKVQFNENLDLTGFYIPIALIASLQLSNQIYLAICRTFTITKPIIFNQLVIPVLQLPILFIFEKSNLLNYTLMVLIIGNLFSLIYFHKSYPIKFNLFGKLTGISHFVKRGVGLLIYNLSYSLLFSVGSTIVAFYFQIESFSQYSFGASLSNASLMVLGSITYIFYSKILNEISFFKSNEEKEMFLNKITKFYFDSSLLLILVLFNISPLLYFVLDDFYPSQLVFKTLLIANLLMTSVFAYTMLLVAEDKQFTLSKISVISILINCAVSFIFVQLKFPFYFIAFATVFSSLIFIILFSRYLKKNSYSKNIILSQVFNNKLGFLVLVLLTIFTNSLLTLLISIAYLIIRKSRIMEILKFAHSLFRRKDIFNLRSS